MQTRAGAEAEARRLMEIAHATGTLELRAEAPTLRAFVEDTFKPLYRTKFRTWRRYEGLLRQGLLDELGDGRVDAIGAPVVRAFMATVAKRRLRPTRSGRADSMVAIHKGGYPKLAGASSRRRRSAVP